MNEYRAVGLLRSALLIFTAATSLSLSSAHETNSFDVPLALPAVGEAKLRIIAPDLLELTLVTTKGVPPARPTQWNFVAANFQYALPSPAKFTVKADQNTISVSSVGFKRRPMYAAFRKRDLRLINQLYLRLSQPVQDWQTVEVTNPDGTLWQASTHFHARREPNQFTPTIHVNQSGYMPGYSKMAMVGYYLGTFGELDVPAGNGFKLLDGSDNVVFQGNLTQRADRGYMFSPTPYQKVYVADFSSFNTPGVYRIQVPGLGTSYPFRIDEGVAALYARTYALGLYHQRCGESNELPFTRHVHEACHTAQVEVPLSSYSAVNTALANFSADYANNPRHTAPRMNSVSASLYPFVRTGRIDVSGGHHDAGDYSKYTINSAQLAHSLIFAVDSYEGVAGLDNLGLPESGDGVSDLLQEAKWETDFLAKMQDDDGGFYFLVYPRNRSYEDNVLPDRGDPQVVFPKNTAATAAAVAALAQAASSPKFKQHYPQAAADYLQKARKGWDFLQSAFSRFGRDGAYQKISHYGNEFMHDDEVAWAAAELYLATGERQYEEELIYRFDPTSRSTLAQGWIRLWEGYGAAIRSYAFGARSGRVAAGALNSTFLNKCLTELNGAAGEQLRFSRDTAYGTSFPDPNKTFHTAGWYFSVNQTYEIATAAQLEMQNDYIPTMLLNMNYEGGCNPHNVSFLTGIGNKRQREMVHQYATNDRRILPPSGLPLGSIQRTYQADLPLYPGTELSGMTFPHDHATSAPHAPYDVWGDAYNLTTEFVNPQQGRSLAAMAYLMAKTSLKTQPWRTSTATINFSKQSVAIGESSTATLDLGSLPAANAQIVWEGRSHEPAVGPQYAITPSFIGRYWVEAEALLPDGRRVSAVAELGSGAVAPTITPLSNYGMRVSGTTGQAYVIEASEDLLDWIPVFNGIFTTAPFDWTDEEAVGARVRFYRLVSGL
ncbi:MAG TPA: glycoside hydrolase family 9 protein [Verrucomicrobiae bacterium]